MWYGRAPVRAGMVQTLEHRFEGFDTCQQVLSLGLLAKHGHRVAASKLISRIDLASLRGSQLPLFVARAASVLGQLGVVEAMARKVHEAAADRSIATGYRQLLELADLLYGCGLKQAAKSSFETAIEFTQVNNLNARKIGVDLATFCLKHPAHFAGFHRVGLGGRQAIEATAVASRP